MPDIYLPNIIKLELTNFSLYCEQSVVMDFSKPVSCLMGANGIGKSTLLNCVNFAITGRINPTNKKLKSIDTLDRGNNYYLQYFDGRISEVDKDYASTRIVFMLGNKRIEVVRNFFPDNSINRTSTLLESSLINALYEDFGVLKEIIGDPQIDLVVPASLWIDYLSVQKQ